MTRPFGIKYCNFCAPFFFPDRVGTLRVGEAYRYGIKVCDVEHTMPLWCV